MKFYVYSLHLSTGKQECVNRVYDTAKEAIEHIRLCYNTDKDLRCLGEYYYFMKQR